MSEQEQRWRVVYVDDEYHYFVAPGGEHVEVGAMPPVLNALEEELRLLRPLAALADEMRARLKMHRVGSLTPDACGLIMQFEGEDDWLARYDAEKQRQDALPLKGPEA